MEEATEKTVSSIKDIKGEGVGEKGCQRGRFSVVSEKPKSNLKATTTPRNRN